MQQDKSTIQVQLVLGLIMASTILGIAGTDLILPAIPLLPEALGGNAAHAQLVLAAYVAGTAVGLIVYGALSDKYATRTLFLTSLLATAATCAACMYVDKLEQLVGLRAIHGMVAAGPAVLAPGIIRAMLEGKHAIRIIGLLCSIESLTPALAPLIGIWFLTLGGWRLSFIAIAVLALVIAITIGSMKDVFPRTIHRTQGSYVRLLRDPVFLRYALSQALALGGLLTFVFGIPTIFVRTFGGSQTDFILMQTCGITSFIIAANVSAHAVSRFGVEAVLRVGTRLSALGALTILLYAWFGGNKPLPIIALFTVVNTGFGLRAPPGFYHAVLASKNDDARGAALVILGVFSTAALGTVIAAPFLEQGLLVLAGVALTCHVLASVCLTVLPKVAHIAKQI
jgi:MFS family permease